MKPFERVRTERNGEILLVAPSSLLPKRSFRIRDEKIFIYQKDVWLNCLKPLQVTRIRFRSGQVCERLMPFPFPLDVVVHSRPCSDLSP